VRHVLEASLKQLGGSVQASSCSALGRRVCHTCEAGRLDEDLAVCAHRLPPVAGVGTTGHAVGGAAVDPALFDKILQRMLLPPHLASSLPQVQDGVGDYGGGGEVGWSGRLFEMLPPPPLKTRERLLQGLLHPSPQGMCTCACQYHLALCIPEWRL